MTQKELSYVEDATGHEDNIIKLISSFLEQVQDEKLVTFFEEEKTVHEEMKQKLLHILEEKTNE